MQEKKKERTLTPIEVDEETARIYHFNKKKGMTKADLEESILQVLNIPKAHRERRASPPTQTKPPV